MGVAPARIDQKNNTAKGVIQSFNGVAAVNSKHQIIVHAEAHESVNRRVKVIGVLLWDWSDAGQQDGVIGTRPRGRLLDKVS
nr:hypothetical protein [uncultured Amphritea sp.]